MFSDLKSHISTTAHQNSQIHELQEENNTLKAKVVELQESSVFRSLICFANLIVAEVESRIRNIKRNYSQKEQHLTGKINQLKSELDAKQYEVSCPVVVTNSSLVS